MKLTKEQVFAKLQVLIVDQLGVEEDEVTPGARFVEDLGSDSFDLIELIMAVEDEFELDIPDEDAEKAVTVQDAVDYLFEHQL